MTTSDIAEALAALELLRGDRNMLHSSLEEKQKEVREVEATLRINESEMHRLQRVLYAAHLVAQRSHLMPCAGCSLRLECSERGRHHCVDELNVQLNFCCERCMLKDQLPAKPHGHMCQRIHTDTRMTLAEFGEYVAGRDMLAPPAP